MGRELLAVWATAAWSGRQCGVLPRGNPCWVGRASAEQRAYGKPGEVGRF